LILSIGASLVEKRYTVLNWLTNRIGY